MGTGADARGRVTEDRAVAVAAATRIRAEEAAKWPDWFIVPAHLYSELAKIPGVHQLRDGTPIVHRSHLALITSDLPVEVRIDDLTVVDSWQKYRTVSPGSPLDTFQRALNARMTPRDYQMVGARFLCARHGSLLADQMRLGKSLCAALSHDPAAGPLLVVGPLNVRPVWIKLFRLLWPDVPHVALDGRSYDKKLIDRSPLVYVHYDVLPTWQSYGWKRVGTFVLDEIHVLSNASSLRSQAANLIALRSERTIGLSGTPAWNEPADMYTLLSCLTPGAWGKWRAFAERYASGYQAMYGFKTGDPSNVDEFRSRMSEIMLRRTWDDVRDQLPETDRQIKVLHLSPEQDRQVTFLCNALREDESTSTVIGTLARLRRVLGEMKLEFLFEIVRPWFGSPFVIWCWHTDVADKVAADLKASGLDVYVVHGGTSKYRSKKTGEVKREEILDAWRAAPAGVLITTISVGQVGIDLSHASRAVFAELDFTPATISQAEMRTFSPERAMEIIYVAVHHPVDETIVEALKSKFAWSDIMGVASSEAAITILGGAFGLEDAGNLERLRDAILSEEEDQ